MVCLKIHERVFLTVTLAMLFISCSPDDPVITTYPEEMVHFIEDSEDGQELFTINVYPDDAYYANDTLMILLKIDSVSRDYEFDIDSSLRDIEGFDDVMNAVTSILDIFRGNIYVVSGADTTFYHPFISYLSRRAHFLKLYDDNYEYHGWRFWGYSVVQPSGSPQGDFISAGDTEFSTKPTDTLGYWPYWRYYNKNNIAYLAKGDSVTFESSQQLNVFVRSGRDNISAIRCQPFGGIYKTGWRAPASGSIFYNLATVEGIWDLDIDTTIIPGEGITGIDTTIVKMRDLAIPFKIDISE